MGVDFHKVCKCGSYHSEYVCRSGIRTCRECGAVLSIDGIFQPDSPCHGITDDEVKKYMGIKD